MKTLLLTVFLIAFVISFIGILGSTDKSERRNCTIIFAISTFANILIYLKG